MTTAADLIHRWNGLQQAIRIDAFRSVTIRYAITKNAQRVGEALEAYRKGLAELQEEYADELDESTDEVPPGFEKEHRKLLEMEEEFPPAYTVSAGYLDAEEDVPYDLLAALIWMIDDNNE